MFELPALPRCCVKEEHLFHGAFSRFEVQGLSDLTEIAISF